jgi:uncharacterized membrane protein
MLGRGVAAEWQRVLERWQRAALVDPGTAGRIRAWEAAQAPRARLTVSVRLLLAFGAGLLAAGVCLFVGAHWDWLSPGQRVTVLFGTLAGLHVLGALAAAHFEALAVALHATGTVALGAAIALVALTFNLREHWPAGLLLWAAGAWLGIALGRGWPQVALAAVLTPAWLAAEWTTATATLPTGVSDAILSQGVLLLTLSYLSARIGDDPSIARQTLVWIGAVTVLPAAVWVVAEGRPPDPLVVRVPLAAAGVSAAYGLPLVVAAVVRGRQAGWNVVAAMWVLGLGFLGGAWHSPPVPVYGWAAAGALGLVSWGLAEGRRERVNLGVAAFFVVVVAFYFATVMGRLERAAALAGLGVLFLGGGWLLERTRRRLVAGLAEVRA